MQATQTTADAGRARLVQLLRDKRVHAFLEDADAYLRGAPDDLEIRDLAVRTYAALGLATAARRSLQVGANEAAGQGDLAALIPKSDRRMPWSRLDAQFQANLLVFDRRTGLGDAVTALWRGSAAKLQLLACTDGNQQVYSRLDDAPGWLPGLFPHNSAGDAGTFRRQWGSSVIRSLAVCGLGLGQLTDAVITASRRIFLDFSAPVLIVEPSLLAWAVNLHLRDWSELLAEPRVTVCAGPQALERFDEALADTERMLPCVLSAGPRWPGSPAADALTARIDEAQEHRTRTQERLYGDLHETLRKRDGRWWARRYARAGIGEPPLTVLGVTSRYTTVLQYAMRDLLAAFDRRGCRTHTLIEADDHAHFAPIRAIETIHQLRPDLIVTIDHLQAEFAGVLPDRVPAVCWIQDQLPHLFRAEAGRGVRPLEFVIGQGFPECVTQFGYPAERYFPCVIPTNPDALRDPDERDEDLAPYRCDVMYATNASSTPDELFQRHRRRFEGPALRFLEAAHETLMGVVREPWFRGDYDYWGLVTRVEKETRLSIRDPAVRSEVVVILRGIAGLCLRQAAIRAAGRWVDESGGSLHLYGRGWESNPEFARFARGVVEHGKPLGRAVRAAKVCLHVGCNPALHQRVLDGLCAGGFFLIQEKPSDIMHELLGAIHAWIGRERPTLPQRVTPGQLPAPYGRMLERSLRMRGADPAEGLLLAADHALLLKAQCEDGRLPRASAVWPCYDRVLFASSDDLPERIEHYIREEDERRALSEQMRAAVLEHFTYDALVRDLLAMLRRRLG